MKKIYAIVLAIGFLAMGALEANGAGPENKPAPPQFDRQLENCTVKAGVLVQFSFRINGTPPPEIEVYFKGTKIDFENQTLYRLYNESGYISFIINEATPEDSGEYTFKITNDFGEQTMKVYLTVMENENENSYF